MLIVNRDSGGSPSVGRGGSADSQVMSDDDFERVRKLIYQRAGISLNSGKHAMVFSRLTRRIKETGHATFGSYLQWLERDPSAEGEWQQFINALTTNLTSFFREEHHFHELQSALKNWGNKPFRLWCCAASTGEEPYSLAMVVAETLGVRADARILATDIDTNVLQTAKRGVYDQDSRGLTPTRVKQHFLKGTRGNEGKMRVKPELAKLIDFKPFNLVGNSWNRSDSFDMIFCRNVMIYFDDKTQNQVLRHLHEVMRPGGLLFVGHSENFTDATDVFKLRGKTVYERI